MGRGRGRLDREGRGARYRNCSRREPGIRLFPARPGAPWARSCSTPVDLPPPPRVTHHFSDSSPFRQARSIPSIRRPRWRIPFHFAHILRVQFLPYAMPCHFEGLTLKFNRHPRVIHARNLRLAAPRRCVLAVRRLITKRRITDLHISPAGRFVTPDNRRNLLFAAPF